MEFLINRYGRLSPVGAAVDFFEVCNEPNRQMWPQLDSQGNRIIGCSVAQMFQTAQVKARAGGTTTPLVTLAGPGMLDQNATSKPRVVTPYQNFMDNLFYYFGAIAGGFTPDKFFAYTTHNYADITDNHSVETNTRAADIIYRLKAKGWTGWPNGDVNVPYILITEGGVNLKEGYTETQQRDLIKRNADLMVKLAGVGMISSYLMYTSNDFDSGLVALDGRKRPAFNMWSCLTSAGTTLTLPSGCDPGPAC